jgi:hypothetical protein
MPPREIVIPERGGRSLKLLSWWVVLGEIRSKLKMVQDGLKLSKKS